MFRIAAYLLALVLMTGPAWSQLDDQRFRDREFDEEEQSAPVKSLVFQDITLESGLARDFAMLIPTPGSMSEFFGGGLCAADVDRDGLVDLYVVGGDAEPNRMYKNLGGNRFQDVSHDWGLSHVHKGSGPAFADMDGDGDLDLFIGAVEHSGFAMFRNDEGYFTDVTALCGVKFQAANVVSSTFGDVDLDGDLDLLTTHWGNLQQPDTEHLWINAGDGQFISASASSGLAESIIQPYSVGGIPGLDHVDYTFSPSFTDINLDGYPDLLVTGDFATSQVFLNRQDGTFERVTDADVIRDQNGMGSAVADYDNDGDLDWFVTAIFNINRSGEVISIGNRLYRNLGDGNFEDVSIESGITRGGWGWGASFADFDLDGHLDIFHTNGWGQGGVGIRNFTVDPVKLFMGTPEGKFVESAAACKLFDNGQGRGVVVFDSDLDGDLDIVMSNNSHPSLVFYRNDGENLGHFLQITLVGKAPNTQALGARVYVHTGDMTQMREVNIHSNYVSHNPASAMFGLGPAESIELIEVRWPDGSWSTWRDVEVDQFLTLSQP